MLSISILNVLQIRQRRENRQSRKITALEAIFTRGEREKTAFIRSKSVSNNVILIFIIIIIAMIIVIAIIIVIYIILLYYYDCLNYSYLSSKQEERDRQINMVRERLAKIKSERSASPAPKQCQYWQIHTHLCIGIC